MNLISIHYGHNCTVFYSYKGEFKIALSEERLTNLKNATGFPYSAFKYVLDNIEDKNSNIEILIVDRTGLGAKFLLSGGLTPRKYEMILKKNKFFQRLINKIKRTSYVLLDTKKIAV